MKKKMLVKFSGLLVAAGCLVSFQAVTQASSADAVGGSCFAVKQKDERTLRPDVFRARVYCTSINWDTKARGTLDRNNATDFHTVWFTNTYVYHYTDWGTCLSGCSAEPGLSAL